MLERPRVTVTLTAELEKMLEEWKQRSGMSYSMTFRYAVMEYLGPKLGIVTNKRLAQELPTEISEDSEENADFAKNELVAHYREILMRLMDENGKEIKKTQGELKELINRDRDLILSIGYEPSIRTICALIVRDDGASKALKEYASQVHWKLRLKERGTIDVLNKPTIYDSHGKAIPSVMKDLRKAWKK